MASPYDRRRSLNRVSADVVEVHLFAAARAATGQQVVTVAPGPLGTVLDVLEMNHPALKTVLPRCSFLVDGVAAHDRDTEIPAGTRIDVLPPFAGG
jgi:molybdopterin synthase sulfur carrier subunit